MGSFILDRGFHIIPIYGAGALDASTCPLADAGLLGPVRLFAQ